MITKIPRMFPAGSIAPHGEPYVNMEVELRKYLKKKTPLYIKRSLIPIFTFDETRAPDGLDTVGVIIGFDGEYFKVNVTNKGAYRLLNAHRDDLAVRIVSVCTNSEMEYGVRVHKILRLELDYRPSEVYGGD